MFRRRFGEAQFCSVAIFQGELQLSLVEDVEAQECESGGTYIRTDTATVAPCDLGTRMHKQPSGYSVRIAIGNKSITLRFSISRRIVP